jgi:hypothetical protein
LFSYRVRGRIQRQRNDLTPTPAKVSSLESLETSASEQMIIAKATITDHPPVAGVKRKTIARRKDFAV